jgi:NAD(P)-dependent dehydrogenase (short-subunit alcohol dehydrogenase family)
MNEARFTNQIAIVTGAARGLGKAVALRLACEGAIVVVNDVRKELVDLVVNEINDSGGQAMACIADVTDETQVKAMVSSTLEKFGNVDILVNNAGIMRVTRPMEVIPLEEFQAVMTVNVNGVFLCMKYVLPVMKARRSGKIVNISSSAGRCMSTFNGAHYTASKAAILGLTRHVARESAEFNINVNAVAPGTFLTEGGTELFPEVTPELIKQIEQGIPMRRIGTPQDNANLVAFLCSQEASYITGATIDINAGELMM